MCVCQLFFINLVLIFVLVFGFSLLWRWRCNWTGTQGPRDRHQRLLHPRGPRLQGGPPLLGWELIFFDVEFEIESSSGS